MYFKKLWVTIILSTFFLYGIALSQSECFLKKGYYQQKVRIDNPETSPLAEAFLRNGISITSGTPYFHFKTTDSEGKFVVFIYYYGDFVGKFVYEKKGGSEETREFVNAFVSWMLRNAWSK